MTAAPRSRWQEDAAAPERYGNRFGELVANGADVDGEARLADTLVPRDARILDAGAGMGRVSAALAARGHRVTGVEPDPALLAQARRTYDGLDLVESDILGYRTEDRFDLIVCVGNVLIYLAPDTERDVLRHFRSLLTPTGRVLAGFHPFGGPTTSREYPPDEFTADAAAAGLRVDHRFGSYDLLPATDAYAVWLLSRDDRPADTTSALPASARRSS